MPNRYWLILFVLLAAAAVAGEFLHLRVLVYCTRPLLMPVLGIWFALETAQQRRFFRNTVLSALGFALAGDLMLMLGGNGPAAPLFALLGVGAFVMTHVFYTGLFLDWDGPQKGLFWHKPLLALPFLLYLVGIVWWRWSGWPDGLRLPLAAYTGMVVVMGVTVLNLRGIVPENCWRLLFGASLLFLLLPVLSAPYRGAHLPGSRALVLLAYALAQGVMVKGIRDAIFALPRRVPVK